MSIDTVAAVEPSTASWLDVTCSPGMTRWMAEQHVSLACTSYQTGKLLLFGRKSGGDLAVHERNFMRSMGLFGDGQTLWMGSQYQLWRLENVLRPGDSYQGHDRLYIPKVGTTTGDLDIHDIVVESTGRPVFVATGFNCLGTVNDRYSFTPLWRPSFVSAIAAEDRCHLNGLALEDGRCKYVTAVAVTDTAGGWRDFRMDGGVVLQVPSSERVASGLSMPHSPRLHRGELWLLNSGKGYLGKIDRESGRFEPLAFCPGYLRGLSFVGDHHALVGVSRPRRHDTFGGLGLDDELAGRNETAMCGLLVIDLRSGETVHWIRLEGMVTELYDVSVLPGVIRPMAIGFKADDIHRIIALGDEGTL